MRIQNYHNIKVCAYNVQCKLVGHNFLMVLHRSQTQLEKHLKKLILTEMQKIFMPHIINI